MTTVILVIHILVSAVLIAVVLMQRSEGGALGIGGGGGGGGGGLMSGRGVAGTLVRTTIIFGAIFFITSIGLTTIASRSGDPRTDIERELDDEFGGAADIALGDDPTSRNVIEADDLLGTGSSDPLADEGQPSTDVPTDPASEDPLADPQ